MTNFETVASLPAWAQKLVADLRTEAASHRQTANDLKAERDTLRTAANEHATAEALAGLSKVLTDPEDLARFVDTATLQGDDGKPDPAKYLDAATALVSERPHLGPRVPQSGGAPVGGARAHPPQSGGAEADAAAGQSAFAAMFSAGATD